jgi:membrane protein implicated in regulation of membrane protease activity
LIILGIILLIIGFITGIGIVWTIGIIAVAVGLILAVAGRTGHAVGGRRHYF